jgi:Tfp pilus assembly protein PilO
VRQLSFYIAIFLSVVHGVQAQNVDAAALGYHDKIPIIINSELYIDTLVADRTVASISRHITVRHVSLQNLFNRTRIISLNDSVYSYRTDNIEFSISGTWRPLASIFENGLLVDTVMAHGAQIQILFRLIRDKQVVQKTTIKNLEIVPKVIGFRIKESWDTTPVPKIRAHFKVLKRLNVGYQLLNSSHLQLSPDKFISFQIDRINESKDSCIEYRIRTKDNVITNWTLAGHLIHLSSFKSNRIYTVDLRYKDSDKVNSYFIDALPKWFEYVWVEIILLIAALTIVILIYKLIRRFLRRRQTKARKLLEQQIKSLQLKLNPHFMFNVLGSIGGLMASDEKERALDSLNSFALMLREVLNDNNSLFIGLSRDIAMMQTYVTLEQLRFDFTFQVTVDPSINMEDIEFPPMLIQPSIENSIKHGIGIAGGMVSVTYHARNRDLVVTIQDNGSPKSEKKKEHSGHGIAITRDRINNLQRLYPEEKITYEVVHTTGGTLVRFIFTNWL